MSPQTMRLLIAGALLVHGIGHTLGIWKPAQALPFVEISPATLKLVGSIIWVIIAAGFSIAALSFYGIAFPPTWWRSLTIVFAVISLVSLVLLGRSWPAFNFMAAMAMNIAIQVALLWLDWPLLENLQIPK